MKFFSTLAASTLGTLIALGIAVLFFFMFIFALAASSEDVPRVREGTLLVAELSGGMPELVSGDPFAQLLANEPSLDLRSAKRAFEKAAVDDRITGLWLRVRSSSIPWAATQELRASIAEFKSTGKPVYASSDDFMTMEGEYFLLSVADSVFAAPGGLFEFNGFAIVATFYKGLLDKLGIEPQIVRSGKFKSAVEPFQRSSMSEENRQQLNDLLVAQEGVYLQTISEARGLSVEELRERASNDAILRVDEAVDMGLVDELIYNDQVIARWKERLAVEPDGKLKTISLARYAKVPASSAGLKEGKAGKIAIVYAVGTIVGGASDEETPFSAGVIGSETFAKAIKEARESDDVKAVVLRIDSPGGFAPAADAMLREVELTAAKKPVVVSMANVAASGGYWMAMAADTIVAEPLTLTGSIGAFSLFFNTSAFFDDKLGITFDRVRTSPYADMLSGVRALSEAETRLLQDLTDETYTRFIDIVAENREMTTEDVQELAQGRVWMGIQAKDVGLVDVLGGLGDATEIAADLAGLEPGSYSTRSLPRPKTFLERMTRSLEAEAVSAWTHVTTSAAERAMREQMKALEEALRDHATVQARMAFDIRID
ncbi:MAG: signal peptide peptidase SppA [Rhodothermales bacterium]|nr:signal peptide peptidase SppA [Rhodothermales bacterium]